jgi:hypothetical protein
MAAAALFVLVVGIPLVVGLFIERIFWNHPFFAKFQARVRALDSQKIVLTPYPRDGLPLKDLRVRENLGDKISLTHHMVHAVDDFVEGVKDNLLYTVVFVILFVTS